MKNNTKNISPLFILLCSVTLYLVYSFKIKENENNFESIVKSDELFEKGKNLFIKNCTACHYIGMDKVATAPALGGITKIRKKVWLYNYTRNSYQMFENGDSIAKEIREKGWGLMSSFPELTNSDLDAIYYFVEKNNELSENEKIREF